MAATQALIAKRAEEEQPQEQWSGIPLVFTAALSVVAILIHGYHPYAEDGGIYLPGILKLIHPDLYPSWTGFVTAQTRFSLFAPMIAGTVRLTGIGLMSCVFCVYAVSIWGTLHAAWLIMTRCSRSREGRYGAVVILALCMTAPAAGTSLLLIDPYVTARSISTPCGLLALAGALDVISDFKKTSRIRLSSLALCSLSLVVAVLMHPLMGAYAGGCVLLLACASMSNVRLRIAAFGTVAFFAIAVAAAVNAMAPVEPPSYARAALSRYYWFLSAWHWYEVLGLIAPLIVLSWLSISAKVLNERGRWLAQMAVSAGLIGLTVSMLFAHQTAHSHFVAMLQPLRIFHAVYMVMFLLVGAFVAGTFLERDPVRWAAICIVLGALMFFVQLETFPNSSHVELPWRSPANDWERGFVWVRDHTPRDATFALDPRYIDSPGEDAQNFRAVAERSSVPDYTKDGGIAAIDPALTEEWVVGEKISAGLATASDDERRASLAQAGVGWVVLPSALATALNCPYQNRSMKVCSVEGR